MGSHLDMFNFMEPCPGVHVKGIKGKIPVSDKGTMRIIVEADSGVNDEVAIPDYVFVPELEMILICPQRWS
jgi:hypothetical protein